MIFKEDLWLLNTLFGVGPLPDRRLYVNFMHVTPKQKKMEKRVMEKWIQRITFFTLHHTLNFVQLLLPPIIHSVSKQAFHYEQNSNLFFLRFPLPPHPEHWFLIPDSWLTAAPHLIIHETQKLATKVNSSSSLWFPWHTRPWEAISFLPFTFFFVRKHWWCTGGIKSWDLVFGHF